MFRDWKKIRVSCKECGTVISILYLRHNMERSRGIVILQVGEGVPET